MTKLPSLCLLVLLFSPAWGGNLSVKRVVDGDTLLLSNGSRVRLIGIDTPEMHPSKKLRRDAAFHQRDSQFIQAQGERSKKFVTSLMQKRVVRLEYDSTNKSAQHKDRYNRGLAYVYFDPPACDELEQGLAETICELDSYEKGFLNALIIEAGYSKAYTKFPFQYKIEFQKYQQEAQKYQRGLWKEAGPLTKAVFETMWAYAFFK